MSDDMKLEEVNPTGSQPENPKNEVSEEWSSLAGSSQERFKKMIEAKNKALQEKQELEDRLRQLETQRPAPMPLTQDTVNMTDEEKIAFNRLTKDLGVVTKKDLEELKARLKDEALGEVQAISARDQLDRKHAELETKYSGEYPMYDRGEIEEEMRKSQIYDPDYHYFRLYKDEIAKVEANKLSGKGKQPFVERTRSKISSTQEWTPDSISERLRDPQTGRDFWNKNKEKINKMYDSWLKQNA